MRYEQILATVVIALLAGTVGAYLILMGQKPGAAPPDKPQTAIERVLKTGKLQCGYIESTPHFAKDQNTGAFSGLWYELTEQIATEAGVQIVWVPAPANLAEAVAALKAGKYDALCSGMNASSNSAKELLFSAPLYYGDYAYARKDTTQQIRLSGQVYALSPDNAALRDFLSAGVQNIQLSGFTENALAKYASQGLGEHYRAQSGYVK